MMKRLLIISFVVVASMWSLRAQNAGAEDLKARIAEAGQRIAGIECDFVQTRTSALLAEPAVSRGRMSYSRPSRLEWTYQSPVSWSFTVDGDEVTMERDGNTQSFDVNQNRTIKEMSRLIISCIEGASVSDGAVFRTDVADNGRELTVTMVPLRKDMKKMWRKLTLSYEKDGLKATRFVMDEASGDTTVIEFKNSRYAFTR